MKKAAAWRGFMATAVYSAVIGRPGQIAGYLNVYCAETNTARSGAGSAENVGKPVNTP